MNTIESKEFVAAAHLPLNQSTAYVGYLRVSSKRQAAEGDSLDVQRLQLNAYAEEHGAALHGPFQDDLSGYRNNVKHRPGLRAAVDEALRRKVPLLVARVDRLTRSLDDLTLLDLDGLVLVAADRGVVSRATLKAAVAKAHAESEAKSLRAKDQHAQRHRPSGWVTPAEFDSGRKKGAMSNKLRAAQRVQEVADFIRKNPEVRNLSHGQRANYLNAAGLQNLKSSKGLREDWTKEALRPAWRAAEALVARDAEGAPLTTSEALDAPISMVAANTPSVALSELLRAELFRRALEADCSSPRAFNEFEVKALTIAIREDRMGPRTLSEKTAEKLAGILEQADTQITPRVLCALHNLLRKSAKSSGGLERHDE